MRMCFVEYLRRSPVKHQSLKSLIIVSALLAARKEFTVGECSCTTCTKGIVRIGVNIQVAINECNILLTRQNMFTTLQEYGLKPQLYQSQGRKQSRRARTHNNDLGSLTHIGVIKMQWGWLGLIINEYLKRKIHLYRATTCINRTLHHPDHRNITAAYTQLSCSQRCIYLGIGRLLGWELQGNGFWHNKSALYPTKITKKYDFPKKNRFWHRNRHIFITFAEQKRV